MKKFSFFVVFVFAQTFLSSEPTKRQKAIVEYQKVISSMSLAATELKQSLAKANNAKSAAQAIDFFTEKMTGYQQKLAELDAQNPELEGVNPPEELVQPLNQLELSMLELAQSLLKAGERFGTDVSFQEAAARMAQALGAEEGEEEYLEE